MKHGFSTPAAHITAFCTIIVWGTTFIASKVLLEIYSPLQIMLMRFFIAYVVLWCLRPKLLKLDRKTELECVLLGLSGCTVYFIAENYALTLTRASNVSILVASAPILTAIIAHFILPDEKLHKNTFIGFSIAFAGVALVVFNGAVVLKLNPAGDLLSIGAALCWAVYSILFRLKFTGYDGLLITRRIMMWGFLTSLPVALIEHDPFPLAPIADSKNLFCLLFLGILGSGICYVLWNQASKRLGAVTVNNYIYIIPFATMIAARIFLHEQISLMGICGAVLILLGVFISDRKKKL